ncbi:hypothetical protein FGB62_18g31 [Gracilaria domingensis]|nr:hypothetical protein FGB62_18g31 [Gracilaria domingensis]
MIGTHHKPASHIFCRCSRSAKGKNPQRKVTKRGSNATSSLNTATAPAKFTPNVCHLEVIYLLQASLNALQVRVQLKSREFSMHSFEQLVRNAADTMQGSKNRRKERELKHDYRTKEERMGSPNTAMRHSERLSIHGDNARVTAILRYAYKERGGTSTAVRMVCEWTLSSMVVDRAEASCVATDVLSQFVSGLTNTSSTSRTTKNSTTPKRCKERIHQARNDSPSSLNTMRGNSHLTLLQRDIWHFMKHFANDRIPENTDKSEAIVKEINGGLQTDNMDNDDSVSLLVACSGDADSVETQVESLAIKGDKNVILSTIDALCHRDLTLLTGDHAEVQNKLSTMASFMVSLREGGTARDDHTVHNFVARSQNFEWPANQQLKRQLEAALVPAIRWVKQPEQDLMVWGDGSVVGNWILLEGYGRGANQESATPPENMWRQRGTIIDKDIAHGTVHLKCTYLTFVSLAV